jgi:enamine deaminase RidA (YjgF/YER057c/UK114 family)
MRNPIIFIFVLLCSTIQAQDASNQIIRHPLPNNSTFPIAQAVELPAGSSIIYLSGTVPSPANPEANRDSREYFGDTETQTVNVLSKMQATLNGMGLDLGDVVKLTVFLVGDPDNNQRMDFNGFMAGYTKFFGTKEQPNLPARSAFQIAGLTQPLMFVEIEAVLVRPKK